MTTQKRRRVAVIGAGPSGLTAARQAQQNGWDFCVFERMDGVGGVWKMAADNGPRHPVAFCSASLVSKDICAFSEFPMPDHFPQFLLPSHTLSYLHLYAQKFNLMGKIRLNAEILKIEKAENWEENGNWRIRWKDLVEGGEGEEEFEAILICTGMRQKKWRPPEWRLEREFRGRILHSEEFTNAGDFGGQTVCVLGMGNSGVKIASMLAYSAKQVILSTRRGAWLLDRLCPSGRMPPWHLNFHSRFSSLWRRFLPKILLSKFWQFFYFPYSSLLPIHPIPGKKPEHDLLSSHFTFGASELAAHLSCGRIRLRPDILSLSAGNSVEFVDGTLEEGVDALILCSGFQFDFSFVEDGLPLPVRHNDFHLFKQMFSPELAPHHSLAVIGHVQPIGGSIWPIAELQSRLFFQNLAGKCLLPPPFWMKAELEKRRCQMSVNFVKTRRHTQMEDHVQFCLELANLIGAHCPPFHRLLLSDPRLALALWFGPLCSSQFRIWGPFPLEDARQIVLNAAEKNNAILRATSIPLIFIAIFCAFFWCSFFG